MFVLSDLNLQLLLGNIFWLRKTANKQSKRLNKNNIYGGAFYKIFEKIKNNIYGGEYIWWGTTVFEIGDWVLLLIFMEI